MISKRIYGSLIDILGKCKSHWTKQVLVFWVMRIMIRGECYFGCKLWLSGGFLNASMSCVSQPLLQLQLLSVLVSGPHQCSKLQQLTSPCFQNTGTEHLSFHHPPHLPGNSPSLETSDLTWKLWRHNPNPTLFTLHLFLFSLTMCNNLLSHAQLRSTLRIFCFNTNNIIIGPLAVQPHIPLKLLTPSGHSVSSCWSC